MAKIKFKINPQSEPGIENSVNTEKYNKESLGNEIKKDDFNEEEKLESLKRFKTKNKHTTCEKTMSKEVEEELNRMLTLSNEPSDDKKNYYKPLDKINTCDDIIYSKDICRPRPVNELDIVTNDKCCLKELKIKDDCPQEKNPNYEMVNNPEHYNKYSTETIDMIELIWGPEKAALWCEITAFKYRMRMGSKPGSSMIEDLKKEDWYIKKSKELYNKVK